MLGFVCSTKETKRILFFLTETLTFTLWKPIAMMFRKVMENNRNIIGMLTFLPDAKLAFTSKYLFSVKTIITLFLIYIDAIGRNKFFRNLQLQSYLQAVPEK